MTTSKRNSRYEITGSIQKEISRIAVGTLACDVIMVAGLFLLSQFGIGKFDILRILLGAACGSVVAILNFTILCLTVQNAVRSTARKKMRQKFQMSYNVRLLLQAAWVVAAYLIPQVHFVAGALPVLFPNVVIFFLQSRGKLVPNDEKPTAGEAGKTIPLSRTSRKIIPAPLKYKSTRSSIL